MNNKLNKKAFFAINIFIIFCSVAYSQQELHLDSLAANYRSGKDNQKDRLQILKSLADGYMDPDKKIAICNELLKAAKAADSTGVLLVAYLQKGNALRLKSNLSEALQNFFEAAKIARTDQLGMVYIIIAEATTYQKGVK